MRISIDMSLSAIENAQYYFEKAKKSREKIKGAEKAIARTRDKLAAARTEEVVEVAAVKVHVRQEREWYERFRWFTASDGRMVIGGRDATTNEIIIKKHTNDKDVVFHTNLAGSPFMTIKVEGEGEVANEVLEQVAEATASYSKAWGMGYTTLDVFWVRGDQVSKSAPAGEYLTKGSFMIYGKKTYFRNVTLQLAIGISREGRLVGGPVAALAATSRCHVVIVPGPKKSGQLAKDIIAKLLTQIPQEEHASLTGIDVDEVQRFIPAGKGSIEGRKGGHRARA